jgi:hypothetical protein
MKKIYTLLFFLVGLYATAQVINVPGESAQGQFGSFPTLLPNGNYLVADPYYDEGSLTDIGAVYLFNGTDRTQISKIKGSNNNDRIGSGGITVLTNGNFVINSSFWNNSLTAITWGNGTTGISGSVGSSNSLIGITARPQFSESRIYALPNGNYIVSSSWHDGAKGALTLGNGSAGIAGEITSANSLVGTHANDRIGETSGANILSNGNFLSLNTSWNSGRGAAIYINSTSGITGEVSSINALVGDQSNDNVGTGVVQLTNGNFVVQSNNWNAKAGAVTWADASSALNGTVSSSNSLIGGFANDITGLYVNPLSNGNYIVRTPNWNSIRGAVTWGSGTALITGVISSTNSLVGTSASDRVGDNYVVFSNGNYAIQSPHWNSSRGAITWASKSAPITGEVSSTNSLVGSVPSENLGLAAIQPVSDHYFVIRDYSWNENRGAVTHCSTTAPTTGVRSSSNSLVGSKVDDYVGRGEIIFLTNGNYVVASPLWNGSRGAVTLVKGATGITGTVKASNSLIGSKAGEQVGTSVIALTDGHYAVGAPGWDLGRGAAIWCNGSSGRVGTIAADKSLTGASAGDHVGKMLLALSNGSYLVLAPDWNGKRGAATRINGGEEFSGIVGISNSLVGSNVNDHVGYMNDYASGAIKLENGNYIVFSSNWNGNRGAVTWGSGITGIVGEVSSSNSLVGTNPGDSGSDYYDLGNSIFILGNADWNNSRGAATWWNGASALVGEISALNSLVGEKQYDRVGRCCVQILKNGNYVLPNPSWNGSRGAVTWGNVNEGVRGVVSSENSLIGSSAEDEVGYRIRLLDNGNYLVATPTWHNYTGAVTWGNGLTGVSGIVAPENSLTGSSPFDCVGTRALDFDQDFDIQITIDLLPNSNYLVNSSNWQGSRGAYTLGNGTSGAVGIVSNCNSVTGATPQSSLPFYYDSTSNTLVVGQPLENMLTFFNTSYTSLSQNFNENTTSVNGLGQVDIVSQQNCEMIASVRPVGPAQVMGPIVAKTWIENAIPHFNGQPYVARHHEITPANSPASSSSWITLYFKQEEFTEYNSYATHEANLPKNATDLAKIANLRIAKYAGTSSDNSGLPPSYTGEAFVIDPDDNDIFWNQMSLRWEVSFKTTGFSGFLTYAYDPALPVTLISFHVSRIEDDAQLNWKTEMEYQADRFGIERSFDAKNFQSIGYLPARNLSGSQTYKFTDPRISLFGVENLYYRLKMQDWDGSFAYSKIVTISLSPGLSSFVYPNPAINSASLELTLDEPEEVVIEIVDQKGQRKFRENAILSTGKSTVPLNLKYLQSGIYQINVIGSKRTGITKSLIVK